MRRTEFVRNGVWAILRLESVERICVQCHRCIHAHAICHTLVQLERQPRLNPKLLQSIVHVLVFEPKKIVIACVIELWNEENRNIERIEHLKYALNTHSLATAMAMATTATKQKHITRRAKRAWICVSVCEYVRTQKSNVCVDSLRLSHSRWFVWISNRSILWFWCSTARMSMNALLSQWPPFLPLNATKLEGNAP